MFGGDPAIPPDQERDRQSEHSSVEFACLCIAHHYRIVHLELPVEVADRFRTIVHGNANDPQAPISIFVL